MPFTDRLHQLRLLPVIALNRAEQAEPLGQTLLAAGLPAAEITFRTPVAAEAIRRLRAAFPELLIAAGTILTLSWIAGTWYGFKLMRRARAGATCPLPTPRP